MIKKIIFAVIFAAACASSAQAQQGVTFRPPVARPIQFVNPQFNVERFAQPRLAPVQFQPQRFSQVVFLNNQFQYQQFNRPQFINPPIQPVVLSTSTSSFSTPR